MSDTIEKPAEAVRGRVITPADSGYDDARVVYDARHDRRPRAVIQCVDATVKAAYDPDNLFHVNQNIAPAKRR